MAARLIGVTHARGGDSYRCTMAGEKTKKGGWGGGKHDYRLRPLSLPCRSLTPHMSVNMVLVWLPTKVQKTPPRRAYTHYTRKQVEKSKLLQTVDPTRDKFPLPTIRTHTDADTGETNGTIKKRYHMYKTNASSTGASVATAPSTRCLRPRA